MKTKPRRNLFELSIGTADGEFLARYSERGLTALEFPGTSAPSTNSSVRTPPPEIADWHRITTKALVQALAGAPPEELPPLDLSAGTEFQRRVWNALRQIACGQTRSYAEIARTLRNPNATRAVGGACGANPVPVFVPCHRVLAAQARLGGFSGGLDWKRTLLAREGVSFVEPVPGRDGALRRPRRGACARPPLAQRAA
jgi:O-6-methylguanine DNA methyltransferase